VTGSQTRLAAAKPATAAMRWEPDTPRKCRAEVITAARIKVPVTASTSRREAGQSPVVRARLRAGMNNAADPRGAATIPARSKVASM